jgi:integrase
MATPNPAASAKITKSLVDKFESPASGQTFIRDVELKGFAVRITTGGAKSFIVEKRIEGQVKRITLGRYPELTVEQARKEAHKLLGKIASGGNPIADKRLTALQAKTLSEAFEDFLNARKALKPRTLYDYQRLMTVAFPDWRKKALLAINKDMVAKRHNKLGEERGEAYANLAMRFLRALFNFSIAQYEDHKGQALIRENPVVRLNQTRAWYRVERRQTVIKPHQLPAWFEGVQALKADPLTPGVARAAPIADYLLFILFTGLRKQEAAALRWESVDLQHRTFTVVDTKNREPLTLPITDFIEHILRDRLQVKESEYVFPGPGKTGYLVEPKRQIQKVYHTSGVTFTLHDLRRTFITVAESLDISAYALKRLVNHKMHNDVTAGYIVTDVERLREPMQRISDYLIKMGKIEGYAQQK